MKRVDILFEGILVAERFWGKIKLRLKVRIVIKMLLVNLGI